MLNLINEYNNKYIEMKLIISSCCEDVFRSKFLKFLALRASYLKYKNGIDK